MKIDIGGSPVAYEYDRETRVLRAHVPAGCGYTLTVWVTGPEGSDLIPTRPFADGEEVTVPDTAINVNLALIKDGEIWGGSNIPGEKL